MLRNALVTCAVLAGAPTAASAESPPVLWQGVKRVGVMCLLTTERGVDTGALHRRLCDRAVALAAAGAPMPVAAAGLGDPVIRDAAAVTLLVQASARPTPAGRVLAVSVRPRRNAADDQLLFAAAPRAVVLDGPGAQPGALDAALGAIMAETLPWRANANAPGGPR